MVHGHVSYELLVVMRLDVLQDGQYIHFVDTAFAFYASDKSVTSTLVLFRILEKGINFRLDVS